MSKLGIYLNYASLALLSLFLVFFPLVFTTLTTDNFVIPKQALLIGVYLLVFLLLGLKTIADREIWIRRTPYDLPILIFLAVVLVGSILAPNRAESLTTFFSLFFAALTYFLFINSVKTLKALRAVIFSYLVGVLLTSLLFLLNFLKIYILPQALTRSQVFTPLGSLLDLAIYVSTAFVLLTYLFFYWKNSQKIKLGKLPLKARSFLMFLGLINLVFLGVLGLAIYSIFKLQNPVILPFGTGFQISFAAISQDTQRWILSFLFGSGFGTFASDFARFKLASFNQTPYWNLTFFRSSSFVLELLATTGVLGLTSYIYLAYKVLKTRPLFVPLLFFFFLSLVLPFSAINIVLLFILLGFYGSLKAQSDKRFSDETQLALVTLKSGLVAVSADDKKEVKRGLSKILPTFIFLIILIISALLGSFAGNYFLANKLFQDSLVFASQNKNTDAYNRQLEAVNLVSYNDAYLRLFSQLNLNLAVSLSNSTPKNASPSAQTQQTIYTLLQQAINYSKNATDLSPNTAADWQNRSGVYNQLIGYGKNADQFAVLTQKEAISLDPTNPNEYITLGGLYYKLGNWDKAEDQFKMAINLKSDFANAYYNLAHTLEQKGDTKGALDQLEIVKTLVKNNPSNLKKIEEEIDALKKGIQSTTGPTQTGVVLPPQATPVPIPAPSTPKPTPTPAPSQQPLGTPAPTPTPVK